MDQLHGSTSVIETKHGPGVADVAITTKHVLETIKMGFGCTHAACHGETQGGGVFQKQVRKAK